MENNVIDFLLHDYVDVLPIDGISIVNLTNYFAKMGNNVNQQALPQDPLQVSIRLIKRSRAKKNKETLNGFIRDI
jgi:hypothetical protein